MQIPTRAYRIKAQIYAIMKYLGLLLAIALSPLPVVAQRLEPSASNMAVSR